MSMYTNVSGPGVVNLDDLRENILNNEFIELTMGTSLRYKYILAAAGCGFTEFTCETIDELLIAVASKVTKDNSYWIGFRVNKYMVGVCDIRRGEYGAIPMMVSLMDGFYSDILADKTIPVAAVYRSLLKRDKLVKFLE